MTPYTVQNSHCFYIVMVPSPQEHGSTQNYPLSLIVHMVAIQLGLEEQRIMLP